MIRGVQVHFNTGAEIAVTIITIRKRNSSILLPVGEDFD